MLTRAANATTPTLATCIELPSNSCPHMPVTAGIGCKPAQFANWEYTGNPSAVAFSFTVTKRFRDATHNRHIERRKQGNFPCNVQETVKAGSSPMWNTAFGDDAAALPVRTRHLEVISLSLRRSSFVK